MSAILNLTISVAALIVIFAPVVYFYRRRTGCDLMTCYRMAVLAEMKWFGFVFALTGLFIGCIDLGYWALGGEIGVSPWALGLACLGFSGIGFTLWKFLGAWLRYETERLALLKPNAADHA